MIKFEKVSFEQFVKDLRKVGMPHISDSDAKELYDNIKLPHRGSAGSAGYDFYSPVSFELRSEDYGDVSITIPTGIRAVMPKNMFLEIVPRSGVGFKTGIRLANSVAVIDADYAESLNEGHIMIKLCSGFNTLNVKAGDRFVQGIFLKYYTVDDDDTEAIRKGGLGSTGV